MTDDDLKRLLDAMREQNAAGHEETRRHFEVTAERLDQQLRGLAESLASVDEKLDRRVDEVEQKMDRGFAETQA